MQPTTSRLRLGGWAEESDIYPRMIRAEESTEAPDARLALILTRVAFEGAMWTVATERDRQWAAYWGERREWLAMCLLLDRCTACGGPKRAEYIPNLPSEWRATAEGMGDRCAFGVTYQNSQLGKGLDKA